MKRALLVLAAAVCALLLAASASAQVNGWAEMANGWGEMQTVPGFTTIPPPASATLGCVGVFLGSPLNLQCAPSSGIVYTVATRSLDVTDGRVQAANLTAIPLATPAGITVTPVLSQIGAITVVAGAALADGDALSVGDGTGIVPIEFDASPGDGTTGGAIPIIFDGTETATAIRDAVKVILDGAGRDWTTSNQGADGIGLVRATPGATGGAITEDVTDAGFSVTTWTDPTHATTVTYQLVACLADGSCTQAGVDSTTAQATATLNTTNYLSLSWSAVSGAASYKVYRKVAPTSPATTGVVYTGTALAVDDTGLAGSGATAPTSNGTGVVTTGRVLVGDGSAAAPSVAFASYPATGFHAGASQYYIIGSVGGFDVVNFSTPNAVEIPVDSYFAWSSSGDPAGWARTYLRSPAAATVGLGAAPNATPVANTLIIGESGSGTNIAGANGVIQSGAGTGSGAGSTLTLKTPAAHGSDAVAQTQTTRMVLGPTGINVPGLATYADNAAALTGGLVAGDVYRTSTGVLMVTY